MTFVVPSIIEELTIVPVLNLEPPSMFDGVHPIPRESAELRELFRRAAPPSWASVPFLEGSECLVPVAALAGHLDELADLLARDVETLGDIDIYGGYAFLNRGMYAFGVAEDSTILETMAWERSVEALAADYRAEIRYACDRFCDASLSPDRTRLRLRDRRSGMEYQVSFPEYVAGVRWASEQFHSFAVAFVPIFARHLQVADPKGFALENFKNRPEWFGQEWQTPATRVASA